jgi:hypothetical protein
MAMARRRGGYELKEEDEMEKEEKENAEGTKRADLKSAKKALKTGGRNYAPILSMDYYILGLAPSPIRTAQHLPRPSASHLHDWRK